VLEPPSDELVARMFRAELCTHADLRRARPIVQRLASDLPAFDSVWLDALAQLDKLTPFQVEVLESRTPDRLEIGPYVLRDRLGGGTSGETFLAVDRSTGARVALKRVLDSHALTDERLDLLRSLVRPVEGLPLRVVRDSAGGWLIVSSFVDGPSFGELLVRRGRFPVPVALEIARQLLEGLSQLERSRVAHGDIRLANGRITREGRAVLVDAGIRSILDPDILLDGRPAPERFDGFAPERIGTGQPPDIRSDLYALGCLLYQLVCGRPPFPGGDSLVKLAAHRAREVPDIREYAPDAPPELARLLGDLTHRSPASRPATFDEVARRLNALRPGGPRVLRRFRASFDRPAPRVKGDPVLHSRATGPKLVAAVLVLAGLSVLLSNQGARTRLLAIGSETWTRWRAEPDSTATSPPVPTPASSVPAATTLPSAVLPELPAPDATGRILLTSPGPWRAAAISTVGPLVIEGADHIRPVIVVEAEPLRTTCTELTLRNIHVRRVTTTTPPAALVLISAQRLVCESCSIDLSTLPPRDKGSRPLPEYSPSPPALAWQIPDTVDSSGGVARLTNCTWFGHGTAFSISASPREVVFENALKIGQGPFVTLLAPPSRAGTRIVVQGSTLRQSGSLLRWKVPASVPPPDSIALELRDSVIEPASGQPLLEFVGDQPANDALLCVTVDGEGTLVPVDFVAGHLVDAVTKVREPADSQYLTMEGLIGEAWRFSGPATDHPADSELAETRAPRTAGRTLGIAANPLRTATR
jgi:eukaryotic-like serine/threonine-protein kinase